MLHTDKYCKRFELLTAKCSKWIMLDSFTPCYVPDYMYAKYQSYC